jgi:hypothetical protein
MEQLTRDEQEWAFRKATGGFVLRYMKPEMTDDELTEALARALGIFGGSGGPGQLKKSGCLLLRGITPQLA